MYIIIQHLFTTTAAAAAARRAVQNHHTRAHTRTNTGPLNFRIAWGTFWLHIWIHFYATTKLSGERKEGRVVHTHFALSIHLFCLKYSQQPTIFHSFFVSFNLTYFYFFFIFPLSVCVWLEFFMRFKHDAMMTYALRSEFYLYSGIIQAFDLRCTIN